VNPILRTLRAYAADAREAFRIAPLEVLLGILVAASFSLLQRSDWPEENWVRILVWVWLSFAPLLAITTLHLRGAVGRPARAFASGGVVMAAGLYAFGLFDPDHAAEMWRFACLMLAGIFFALLTPAIPPRAGDRLAHWQFAFGLLARAFGVAVYSGVLFLALAGAVASVVNLFELPQPDRLYGDMAAWIFLAAAPWILVGGVPRLLEDAVRQRDGAPLMVVRFGRFVYAPVVVVYLAILYAYGAKVLFTQELPKNLVSPLVLAAGLLGMAGALLMEPLHADREQRGLSLLVRWVPALLLPLLPFAYLAILMRQGQYGWTEFRYLRLAGTVLLTVVAILGTVWLARRKMPPLASVPGILALGLLLVSIGPWSAQAVSRRDQQRRLRTALREAGVPVPVRFVDPAYETTAITSDPYLPGYVSPRPTRRTEGLVAVGEGQYQTIRETARYLAESHGMDAVVQVVGPGARRYRGAWEMAEALPVRLDCRRGRDWAVIASAGRAPVAVRAGRVVGLALNAGGPVHATQTDSRLTVTHGGWTATADLTPLTRRLLSRRTDTCDYRYGDATSHVTLQPEEARFPLTDAGGVARGEVVLRGVQLRPGAGGVAQPVLTGGFILLY